MLIHSDNIYEVGIGLERKSLGGKTEDLELEAKFLEIYGQRKQAARIKEHQIQFKVEAHEVVANLAPAPECVS